MQYRIIPICIIIATICVFIFNFSIHDLATSVQHFGQLKLFLKCAI